MILREVLEKEPITRMENITVKLDNKSVYDGTILYLLESNSPLLSKSSSELIYRKDKGVEVEVF